MWEIFHQTNSPSLNKKNTLANTNEPNLAHDKATGAYQEGGGHPIIPQPQTPSKVDLRLRNAVDNYPKLTTRPYNKYSAFYKKQKDAILPKIQEWGKAG